MGVVVESTNRKLIRPSLTDLKDQMNNRRTTPNLLNPKKASPPDQTNAENFYYMKQMQAKTPMVFVLKDGETLEGVIEWYDKTCLKINREGAPNLLIYKPNIKYMYNELVDLQTEYQVHVQGRVSAAVAAVPIQPHLLQAVALAAGLLAFDLLHLLLSQYFVSDRRVVAYAAQNFPQPLD